MSLVANIGLAVAEFFAHSYPNLLLNQICAGDAFGNRMLHLDTGIHLQKIEVVVCINDELNGAGVRVSYRFYRLRGGFADFGAELRRD